MEFRTSTQRTRWMWPSLADLREHRARLAGTVASADEETLLRRHWLFKLLDIGASLKLSDRALAVSALYFQRYCTRKSIQLDAIDSLSVLRTCIFLATKTSESRRGAAELAAALQCANVEQLLAHELDVLVVLRFDLHVHHAFAPLDGLFYALKRRAVDGDVDALWASAARFLRASLTTDVAFVHAPSQIAAAALLAAASSAASAASRRAVCDMLVEHAGANVERDALVARLDDIGAQVRESAYKGAEENRPPLDDVKRIDRAIKTAARRRARKRAAASSTTVEEKRQRT
jgi:Cyclin C-terminal domain/Cyclin, N-terminal domain